jgi:D-inositol-3-phosphate glycosyltransferase
LSDARAPGGDRLRVLVVTSSRQVWGAERSVMAMAGPLAELGIDLSLGSPPGGDLEAAWRGLGLTHVPLDLPPHAGIRATAADGPAVEEDGGRPPPGAMARELLTTARSARLVARAARHADVVQSEALWGHLDCALGGRLAHRPVVIELQDLVRPGLGRRLLSAAARLSAATIAISTAVAGVIGNGNVPGVRVVLHAVDLDEFSPGPADPAIRRSLSDEPHELLVGILGRVDPMKGVDVLVRAMALLGGPAAKARLVVVGAPGLDAGGYEREVRAEADRLLGVRARFVGRMDDVQGVLRSLDVLVNASAAEPFGLTVLEAQASGVPVVAPRSGGIPDFVHDDDNGLLVPPGDAAALAEALERLLGNADLRARLGRRGRETAVAEHGLAHRATVLAGIYRAAARREPVPCVP